MSDYLTCACDYDPEPGDVLWNAPDDYSTLDTKRSRTCCSCGARIKPGDTVAAYPRYKVPECGIELRIYGEGYDDGPPRATHYHCERCADLAFSLSDLGFCLDIHANMLALAREYAREYGPEQESEG